MSTTKSEFSNEDLTNLAFISELQCHDQMVHKVGVSNYGQGHTETHEEKKIALAHQLK